MDCQRAAIPFGDGGVRLHRRAGMAGGGEAGIDRKRGIAHRVGQVALPRAFLVLGLDRLGIEGHVRQIVRLVGNLQVLGGIARLLEGFCHHQRERLAEIAHLPRLLLRRFASGTLRAAGDQPLVVDHRHHAVAGEAGIGVDGSDLPARERRGDKHAFEAVLQRVFGGIGRGTGCLRQRVDPHHGLADHALAHVVEAAVGIRLVLFEVRGHSSVSVASASTAASVRRASGILKSLSP